MVYLNLRWMKVLFNNWYKWHFWGNSVLKTSLAHTDRDLKVDKK